MVEFWIAMGVISLTNLIARTIKCDITKKKVIEMFEDNGYEVNKKLIPEVFNFDKEVRKGIIYIRKQAEKIFGIIPLTNIYYLFLNVKYFTGDHSKQSYYDDLFDFENWKEYDSIGIKDLIKKKIIKEDKDKMEMLNALNTQQNTTIQSPIHKYDTKTEKESLQNIDATETTIIVFHEEDSRKELQEKIEQLQRMLEEKERKEATGFKLEYKPSEAQKFD